MIGVAPHNIDLNVTEIYRRCGWHLHTYSSTLYSGPPMSFNGKVYSNTSQLATGSTVSVKLDMDKKEISYIINGTDYGVAYNNIPIEKELCLCAMLYTSNGSIEIV